MLQLWFVANTVLWPFSIKVGGLTLGLNMIALLLAGTVWLGRRWKISVLSARIFAALLVYMVFSWFLALAGTCDDKFLKAALTAPILLLLVLIGSEAGHRASCSDWIKLEKTVVWVLLSAFLGFAAEMIFPQRFTFQSIYRATGKYSGIFQEPSHVAFSLFPCVAILFVAESKRSRRIGMAALLGLLVFSRSSTLIALIAAWLLYRLVIQRKIRQAVLLVVGAASLIAVASAINYDALVAPTIERVVGIGASDQTDNVSSLVYVQGWEDTWANLLRTHGRGLGINMMGCSPLPDDSARALLSAMGIEGLNAEDGSFLFAKVVSETGLAGIAFYIVIIWWWVGLERQLIHVEGEVAHTAVAIQAAIVFCFVASSFIRGAGYFSGGLLLCVAAVSGASKCRQQHAAKPNTGQSRLEQPGAIRCA